MVATFRCTFLPRFSESKFFIENNFNVHNSILSTQGIAAGEVCEFSFYFATFPQYKALCFLSQLLHLISVLRRCNTIKRLTLKNTHFFKQIYHSY